MTEGLTALHNGIMVRGQVLMIVLLVLGVGLTIGLAIVSRSITDVSISTTQEESARALDAAEAGVEQALGGIISGAGSGVVDTSGSTNDARFNVEVNSLGSTSLYESITDLVQGDVISVDVSNMNRNGNLRLCWGRGTDMAALEAIMYYSDGGVLRMTHNGYYNGSWSNFLDNVSSGCTGMSNSYKYQNQIHFQQNIGLGGFNLPVGSQPLLLRLRMLNNTQPQPLGVLSLGGGSLDSQGKDIIATGISGSSTQRVRVQETGPDLPAIFDNAIFSGTSVQK